ncbi:MAG: gamma-glutamyl-gamma-aminobutyrate hydrolase family protein [Phycisphaerales bacterium]|nr:gamma-glutamyl-gamma-aminobutyrate hydrolase family protein [Phycisphaerales bacterium]NUQ77824.1 gamma-glutamyl-gamma-aminobutyrate hydrolase family protein [Polyangiaceae bacterium]
MRPAIGITSSFSAVSDGGPKPRLRAQLNAAYTDAVIAAGGAPYVMPVPPAVDESLLDDLLRCVDGVLFTGGSDLDPRHYGQERHPKTEVMHERRDAFELALFRRADAARKPIFCVCLGFQVAHVGRGGALIQHIPDLSLPEKINHRMTDESPPPRTHGLRVEPGSYLSYVVGSTQIDVNSRHHQAVDPDRQGRGLKPVGWAPDGLVEASEDMDNRFLLAVQWHPEDMIEHREHLALFKALVEAAAKRR